MFITTRKNYEDFVVVVVVAQFVLSGPTLSHVKCQGLISLSRCSCGESKVKKINLP